MGIKQPTCHNCNYIKDTLKHKCKFPNEWGNKRGLCSGQVRYRSLVDEAVVWVMQNYKTLR